MTPQNEQAEKASLSILHHSPECLSGLQWNGDLFNHPARKTIFRAIEESAEQGQPCDLIALTSRLEANGKLETVGGASALTEILFTFGGPNPHQADYYHEQLVKSHVARETVKAARENLTDLERMDLSPSAFAEKIATAAQGPEKVRRTTLAEHLDDFVSELERSEPPEAFPTGVTRLDVALDGSVHRGELLVAAGETSGGKSVLLSQAAIASAQGGKAVAFFSLEMPARAILRRMAANLANTRIKNAREMPTSREMDAFSGAVCSLSSLPLTIIDSIAGLSDIETEARRLIRLKKADVVIVDYLQLVENSGVDNREQQVAEIARKLKNLALVTQCGVFTASQLNEDGRLRESRAIGHHADFVINIANNYLVVGKNRRGPRDVSIPVTLRGELGRFEER